MSAIDDDIRERGVDTLTAVLWCRQHNAYVRFESNGTVSVKCNLKVRRRKTLLDAVLAHVKEKT
jgi:hypothetical protein